MKKLKILASICFCSLMFTFSFNNNFKVVRALKKTTNITKIKDKKNSNLKDIQKITLKIPEKDVFMRGLTVILTEENVLKNFLKDLKITAELNEQKASFFDMVSKEKDGLKEKDGIYVSFSNYYKNLNKKEQAFKKTKKFLENNFEEKLKNLSLDENDIEQGLVKLGYFLNSNYQAEKHNFLNLKNRKKQILSNNLKDFKLILKNKNKFFELFDKEPLANLKNNKNWEENQIKNFEKELLTNLEKEAKENFQQSEKLLKEFLKFISGHKNIENAFEKYEKIEKQKSSNSNKSLKEFFKKLFKENKKRKQIIKNLKKCVKNSKLNGLKEKQFENKNLKKHEIVNKLNPTLNLLQNNSNYNKLKSFLKNKQKQKQFKEEINFVKNLNSNIAKTIFSKENEKNKQKISLTDLDKLEKIINKFVKI